ncbi:EamA family transporter [Rathayibacter toxicus]|nr:EamA family transporter [Rathayibacter toxicus]
MPVGVALPIEYLAPVFLVLFGWARTQRHPGRFTLVWLSARSVRTSARPRYFGAEHSRVHRSCVGTDRLTRGCVYYAIAARVDPELPPVALTAGAMAFGAMVLLVLGVVGFVPLRASFVSVILVGNDVSWLLPAIVILGLSTVMAYLLRIQGSLRLGTRIASFIGLTEVLFSIVASWGLLGELPIPLQFADGVFILVGVVLVHLQTDQPRPTGLSANSAAPTLSRRR